MKFSSAPIGVLHQERFGAQLFTQLFDDPKRIRAGAVHLVDERNARNLVTLHLAVDRDRLTLNAADAAQYQHGAVEDAQRSLHFDSKVDVAGRIDQVDLVSLVLDAGCGAGDRNPTLTLQFHMVHRGAIAVTADLFDLVNPSGVKQNPLAQGGFPRIDMGTNPDVSQFLQTHNFHLNSTGNLMHSLGREERSRQ